LNAEETPVHRLRLNDPGRKVLLPQRPEDGNKRNWNQNVQQNLAGFLVKKCAGIITQASGRNMHEFFAAPPENDRSDGHEDDGQPECDVRTMQTRALKKTDDRRRQFGDESVRIGCVWLEEPGNK